MKQTNNAIKFLMAQYRAIFKNANIAMVAAMVASALAAGQAQAAAGDQFEPNALGETQLTDSLIGSGESVEHDASSFGTLKAPSSAAIKIENGGSLSLTAADAQHKGHIFTGNDLIVNSGGSITLSGTSTDKKDVAGLVGVEKDISGRPYTEPTASLTINKGSSLTIRECTMNCVL